MPAQRPETLPKASKPKAPLIIFGTMFVMSLVSVAIVFVTHSQRTEPYLQSKQLRVHYGQTSKNNTLSLNYRAFGPQSIAQEIIGKQRWQWIKGEDETPAEAYDIKVVVYRDVSAEELTKRFPLIVTKRMDSRYLKFDDAIAYLDRQLASPLDPELIATLRSTRKKLLDHFDPE